MLHDKLPKLPKICFKTKNTPVRLIDIAEGFATGTFLPIDHVKIFRFGSSNQQNWMLLALCLHYSMLIWSKNCKKIVT